MSVPTRSLPRAASRAALLSDLIAAVTGGGPGTEPLVLHDRGRGDPTVALLDAWATVGDVIGFYLDRIADEGYVATAGEPGSLLALAGLLGHRPRPGLAAMLHLAYTLQADPDDKAVLLPPGLASQSVPGPGEQPQTFATTAPLLTRPSWSTLRVKQTMPLQLPKDGVKALDQIVVAGTTNRLSANDVILLSVTGEPSPSVVRVASADVDARARQTTVRLQPDPPPQQEPGPPGAQDTIAALDDLAPALSIQPPPGPASRNELQHGPKTVFGSDSDAVPRLLASIRPELAPGLYGALASVPLGAPAVSGAAALRVTAAPFGAQAPPRQLLDDSGQPAGTEELAIGRVHALELDLSVVSTAEVVGRMGENLGPELQGQRERLAREAQAAAGHRGKPVLEVSCESLLGNAQRNVPLDHESPWTAGASGQTTIEYPVVAKVQSASPVVVTRYGQTRKVTELELSAPWIGGERLLSALRALTVHAQPDPLGLQPVPKDEAIQDDQIELEGLVAGMEAGHLIVVTGERSDLPAGASVMGGELAMVASVSQGAAADGERPHSTLKLAGRLAFRYVRSSVTIYGNVVPARQGPTIREVLGSGRVPRPVRRHH